MRRIYNIYKGADPVHPRASRRRVAVPWPPWHLSTLHVGSAAVVATCFFCNVIRSLIVWTFQRFFLLLSGVGDFVLGFLILVLFCVGGFSPTTVSSSDGRLHPTCPESSVLYLIRQLVALVV